MSTFRSPVRRACAVLLVAIAVAGCGASTTGGTPQASAQAPTPQPATATPALTSAPTAAATASPTDAPTVAATDAAPSIAASLDPTDNGGFAFKPGDVLDYYVSQGFDCKDPQPSTQAADYTIVRCFKTDDAGTTAMVALVVSADGVTGNAFAGYLNPAGSDLPDKQAAAAHLGGFLAARLGTDLGSQAATWLGTNFGAEGIQKTFGPINALIYGENDENGVGYFTEVVNDAFMKAPAP